MAYLFILCAVFSLLFFVLLATNPEKRHIHRFLMVINALLVSSSLHIFLFYRSGEQFYMPYFSEINWAIPLLYGLLFWLYTKSLIDRSFTLRPIHSLHFIPFVAFLGYLLVPILEGELATFTQHGGYPVLKLIVNPIYLIAVVLILHRHNQQLKEQFSYIGEMHHYWLSWLAIGGLGLWFIACIGLLVRFMSDSVTITNDYILLSFLSLYLFVMSYVGFSHTEIFQRKKKVINTQKQSQNDRPIKPIQSVMTQAALPVQTLLIEQLQNKKINDLDNNEEKDAADVDLYNYLLQFMNDQKPYLNPSLSLNDLATSTGIAVTKLSSLINQQGQKNFYDFVNSYRVRSVQEALLRGDTKEYSLLGIAQASGFNSKATFYRIFKKVVGMTPAQFEKKNSKNKST